MTTNALSLQPGHRPETSPPQFVVVALSALDALDWSKSELRSRLQLTSGRRRRRRIAPIADSAAVHRLVICSQGPTTTPLLRPVLEFPKGTRYMTR